MITTTPRTKATSTEVLDPVQQAAERVLARGLRNAKRNGNGKHVSRETIPPALRNTTLPTGIAARDPEAGPAPDDAPSQTPFGWAGAPRLIALAELAEDPRNARQHYDPEALQGLADSIRAVGILQPLLVRLEESGCYRVIAGHRRLRAAALAGLREVPVLVRECDDPAALVAQALENLQREDLNAWEEAVTFRRLCQPVEQGGGGMSQADLARKLGCTPSRVSNALRLLELPAWCAAELQAGRMAATLGRETLRALSVPAALEDLRKRWKAQSLHNDGPPDRGLWADEIDAALRHNTERIEESYIGGCQETNWRTVPLRPLTEEERRQCDVRRITMDGSDRERACNRKAYAKVLQQQKAEAIAQHQQKTAKKSKAKDNQKPLTPAEKKRQAAEAAKRSQQQAEALAGRREELRIDWLAMCCVEYLRACDCREATLGLCAVLLTGDCHRERLDGNYKPEQRRREIQGLFAESLPRSIVDLRSLRDPDLWSDLQTAVMHCLWDVDDDEPRRLVSARAIELLAADLHLKPAALWAAGRKTDPAQPLGPLTLRLWDLFTRDELTTWAQACGCDVAATAKKTELIEALETAKRLDPPAWLLGEKPAAKAKPKRKPAKAGA